MHQGVFYALCVLTVQSSLGFTNIPCKKYDSKCFTDVVNDIWNTAIKGDPSLNLLSLDPMKQEYISGKFSFIRYKAYNSTLIGARNCHIPEAKLDIDKNSMLLQLLCPNLSMFGVYEVTGKLLIVPIEGKGDYRLDAKNYHIHVDTVTRLIRGKDGKEYLNFKSFKLNSDLTDLKGGLVVDLKNLFNGQHKELANAALKVANEQWKPVSQLLQGPILDANVKNIINNMNKYLKTMPFKQLLNY